jgi:N-acetylglutamate synthase-like GNAT family acetyltransferase
MMSKKSWTIRKAVMSDAEPLNECMQAAYKIYTSRLGGKTLPPMMVDYEEEIRSFPVWVAESDGSLVGGLILMPEAEHMTIANIAVHPQFQGNGLGRGLMKFGETKAKQKGYSELCLATHTLLTENLSLYFYLGWSETGRDESRVYMEKNIA